MTISYELIDVDDGNLVGSYATEAEAEMVVLAACAGDGLRSVRSLALIKVNHATEVQELVADGVDLARRVTHLIPGSSARSA